MPRMIYSKDSTAMHLNLARRHVRLCGRVPGAEPFADAIRPAIEKLNIKENERKTANEAREEAYDLVVLYDLLLDNAVRTTFQRVGQYDREHLTRTLDLLFPAHGYSNITKMSMSEEPQEVNKLIEKMDGLKLEEGHPLKELIAPLREKKDNAVNAWKFYQSAIVNLGIVEAREEHERLAVRQQYEHNWLDARKQYGTEMANSLFPKIGSHSSKTDPVNPTPENEA